MPSPVGKWNLHLHKVGQQQEAWSALKLPGIRLCWPWTSENTVDQHQQMTNPKPSLTVETLHWTSSNVDSVPLLSSSRLWDPDFQRKCKIYFHQRENSVLLKCRKLRREDQEISDSIVGFFIEKNPSVMVGCSHRNLILSHFYRVSYRQNWRRDFLELKHQRKHTSEGNKPNESTSGQDKVICRSKVESLSSLTHWS